MAAEKITMTDGSTINGHIVRLEHKTIVFETKFAGTLNIDINDVYGMHTTEDVTAILDGGDSVYNQSIETRDEKLILSGEDAIVTEVAISKKQKN